VGLPGFAGEQRVALPAQGLIRLPEVDGEQGGENAGGQKEFGDDLHSTAGLGV
jgi:hypothetical protein